MKPLLNTALSGLLLVWVGTANGHPVHASYAEMEYNPESRSLEVALRLQPEDLNHLLKPDGTKGEKSRPKDFGTRIVPVLKKYFHVTDPDSKMREIKWIGHEVDLKEAWLYFEISLDDARIQQCMVENSLFLGNRPRQINTVFLKHGRRSNSFHFFRGNSDPVRMKLKPARG